MSSPIAGGLESRLLLNLFVLLVNVVDLGELIPCSVAIVLIDSFHSSIIKDVFKPNGSEPKMVRTIAAVSILFPWLPRVNENETAEVGSEPRMQIDEVCPVNSYSSLWCDLVFHCL